MNANKDIISLPWCQLPPCTCSNPVICLRSEERKRKESGRERERREGGKKDIRADKSRLRATFFSSFFFSFALSTAHLGRRSAMTTRFHDVPLLRRRAPRRRAAFALHAHCTCNISAVPHQKLMRNFAYIQREKAIFLSRLLVSTPRIDYDY